MPSVVGTTIAFPFLRNGLVLLTLGKAVRSMFANTLMVAVGYAMIVVPILWLARPVRMLHPY
jgi:hypothetical protein